MTPATGASAPTSRTTRRRCAARWPSTPTARSTIQAGSGSLAIARFSLVGPGTTEALAGLTLGERDDRLPDRVLVLGVAGPRPDAGRPRPLEFVRAELSATGVAVGR